jgi:hypothetical protein
MTYTTMTDALAALETVEPDESAIINFVRQLSVDAKGSTTVLYSNTIGGPNGTQSWMIVGDMQDVRRIDDTLAAKALWFRQAAGTRFELGLPLAGAG